MEIEVNDYVRTKAGNIFKITGGNSDDYDIDIDYSKLENTEEEWYESNRYNDNGYWFDEEHILKHSNNIIDLIECGDVILYDSNYLGREIKMEVDYVRKKEEDYKWGEGFCSTCIDEYIHIEDIKSIVTKEQFSSLEYII